MAAEKENVKEQVNKSVNQGKLDLVFERTVDIPKELIWRAWTEPELLMQWFCPLPWKTVACEIDLRAGGQFASTMESPEGQQFPNMGCYLEVIPNQKLVWTNALLPGFQPSNYASACGGDTHFNFTIIIQLEEVKGGTHYTATVMHADEEGRAKHEAMGFQDGWGKAFDQLIALMKK